MKSRHSPETVVSTVDSKNASQSECLGKVSSVIDVCYSQSKYQEGSKISDYCAQGNWNLIRKIIDMQFSDLKTPEEIAKNTVGDL